MMFLFTSVVPPAMVSERELSIAWPHGPSTSCSSSAAVFARRWPECDHASLITLPSGPGGRPACATAFQARRSARGASGAGKDCVASQSRSSSRKRFGATQVCFTSGMPYSRSQFSPTILRFDAAGYGIFSKVSTAFGYIESPCG